MLRSAIPFNISIKKTVALVNDLAKLHNFCIDAKARQHGHDEWIADSSSDIQYLMMIFLRYFFTITLFDTTKINNNITVGNLRGNWYKPANNWY